MTTVTLQHRGAQQPGPQVAGTSLARQGGQPSPTQRDWDCVPMGGWVGWQLWWLSCVVGIGHGNGSEAGVAFCPPPSALHPGPLTLNRDGMASGDLGQQQHDPQQAHHRGRPAAQSRP